MDAQKTRKILTKHAESFWRHLIEINFVLQLEIIQNTLLKSKILFRRKTRILIWPINAVVNQCLDINNFEPF